MEIEHLTFGNKLDFNWTLDSAILVTKTLPPNRFKKKKNSPQSITWRLKTLSCTFSHMTFLINHMTCLNIICRQSYKSPHNRLKKTLSRLAPNHFM